MIFISHKKEPDHERALEFQRMLNDLGIETWIAPEGIPSGHLFAKDIPCALQKCEKVLFILTEDSMKSGHVLRELDMADRFGKEIVPVQIGDFPLSQEFMYLLSGYQIKQWNEENRDGILSQLMTSSRVYELKIQQRPPRKITLIRGDFQDNLDYALENKLVNPDQLIVATVIDRTGDLNRLSSGGILQDLCPYICEKFNCEMFQLQHYINQAKKEQLHHKSSDELMEFGDSILVKLPIDSTGTRFLYCLFIANTERIPGSDKIKGIDSREIVLKVFSRCIELGEQAKTLFVGAIGTNKFSFPYEVISAEILNAFVYSAKMDQYPMNLIYSVRNEDMNNAGVTSQSVYNYVSNVVSFLN